MDGAILPQGRIGNNDKHPTNFAKMPFHRSKTRLAQTQKRLQLGSHRRFKGKIYVVNGATALKSAAL
ncbi:hypothetical protein TMES_09790 [Thalassospira mesophila]|uniref:Uncharacterized protein n=1 Tax=Thalassospira mesophila TaxID=1293891 RepID=A0A1Y2L3V7_9PROT|nr:hypothetical protein TMES_09790 [Thalassospira mesophila]